jgi:hypothetical protein
MYGPSFADPHSPNDGNYPGICQLQGACKSAFGYFVPYRKGRRINGALQQFEARIRLHVVDLSSSYSGFIPFVIDSGTDVTIIPRKLVPSNAFAIGKQYLSLPVPVSGLTGRTVWGRAYRAGLTIFPTKADHAGLRFETLTLLVVEDWESNYAMLGLDALRQVVMVSDGDYVSFWPAPTKQCQA